MATIDLTADWCIVSASPDPVASFAAAELQDVLRRVTSRSVPVAEEPRAGASAIILSHGDGAQDGFRWQAAPGRIELYGHNGRGLLYAVYSLLEAMGCRWLAPGPEGERLAQGARFELPEGPVVERPSLPGRCLIVGHYVFMKDVEGWIVWAARNRLNALFAHVIDGPLAMGSAPESQWQAHKAAALRLARQRGMTIEHGGHGLTALLPRKLFKRMPEAFRVSSGRGHKGRRTPDHNFCPSSEGGLDVIRQNAEAHFRAHPEADVFHLWPDDIPGGGWCACDRCRACTPAEQALLAVNAVAEVLQEVNPAAQIAFLAYMDTEEVPAQVLPRRNVCLSWAPRSRCYAHATDDDACPVNVPHYAETFCAQVEHFRAAGARPPRIFEYCLDALLFKSLLPPLPTVMQGDLRFYRDAGAHTVQALMTGDRPWLTPQLNAWLFARLSWNPDQELDALLADFGRAAFGIASLHLPAYYRALERAFALALDIAPQQVPLDLDFDLNPLQLIDEPLPDMGDPVFAPPEVLRAKCQTNAEIDGLVQEAAGHLQAVRSASIPEAWAAEWTAFELARAWLRYDLSRVRLYDAVASMPVAPDARRWLDEAQAALDDVLAWGEAHIADPSVRLNFRAVHRAFWQLRLDKIRGDHFAGAWRKRFIQVKSLIQIAGLFLRMKGMYEG